MKNTKLAFQWASILAITASSVALGQYFPPSGGGTGPTTNPVSIVQGGTGSATAPANTVFGNNTGSTAAPAYFTLPAGGVVSSTQYQVATYLTTGASVTGSPQFTNNAGNVTFGDATHAGTLTVETGTGNWTEFQTGASQVSNVAVNWPITNGAVGQLMCPQDSLGDLLWETLTGDITIAKNGATTLKNTGAGAGSATAANITVDAQGRVTAYSNGSVGTGTVTSVTFTGDGTVLSSTPSTAVTTSGTVLGTLLTQAKNVGLFGPASGANAAPTFRAEVAADQPSTTVNSTGNLSPLFTSSISAQALSFSLSNTANAAWFGATSATAPSFQAGALPISLGGTDNASLVVTAGGIVYTDGTKLVNTGAGAAGNVLTYPASGSVPIWQAPAGGTITSSTTGQVPVFTGATTVAGNTNFTYNAGIVTVGGGATGGAITIARGTGLVAQLNIQGNTSGDCQILAANIASSGSLTLPTAAWIGPTVTITEPTSLPSSTVPLTISSAGVLAPGTASTPGFGGDGSDGAITTWTKPLLNATTVTTSSSTGPTTYGCIVVNSTGAQAYNSSAVINLNVLGYASPASVGGYASSPTSASSGGGPCGGRGAPTNALSAAGGGNGGAGGSGSALNGVGVGVAGPAAMPLGRLDMGSAGGQGSDGNQAQKVGGFGGGYAKLCAVGNITFASGSLIEANGGAGTAESSSAVACSGGGAGGTVAAFSQGTLTIAAGTVTCIGGAGGSASGSTTGYGGAGGGGGDVFGMSTSAPSNSLVTATACAGGAGGASGSSGNPGAAGSNGIVTMNTGTPNAPLISCMEHGGYQKWFNHLREYPNDSLEICLDEHGYSGHIDALVAVVAESPQEYVAFLSPTHGWGFGFDRLHQTEKVDKARREDAIA